MTAWLVITLALSLAGVPLLVRLSRGYSSKLRRETDPHPKVSIIIPARDEEKTLPRLLSSLQSDSGAIHEVIVVDDDSSDHTAKIAESLGARVVHGTSLPQGWTGKAWACWQGAAVAKASHLLFLDADTWFEQGGLDHCLADYAGGAFSVGPWHQVKRPYEHLSLFFNVNMSLGSVPSGLFGQMLLIDKKTYRLVGGHESVKGSVLENLMLAKHLHTAGVPVHSVLGKGRFSFRMYPEGFTELARGWGKGFSSGAGRTPGLVLALAIAWMSGLAMAAIGMVLAFSVPWALMYLLCAGQVWWAARMVGSFQPLAALLYPLPLLFFFAIFGKSMPLFRKPGTWKGRQVSAH